MRVDTQLGDGFRDRPVDDDQLQRALDREHDDLETLEAIPAEDRDELQTSRLGRVLNRLSRHHELAENYGDALQYGRRAVDVWDQLGRRRARFLAELRVARLRHHRGDTDAALEALDRLVEATDGGDLEVYRDFALESRGRVAAEAGETERAETDFARAIEIRRSEGRDALVEPTRRLRRRAARTSDEDAH